MTPLSWIIVAVAIVVIAVVWLVAARRMGGMPPVVDDRPGLDLPDEALGADDLKGVRFAVVSRGYSMAQVDALLDRLAMQLGGGAVQPTSEFETWLNGDRPPVPEGQDAAAVEQTLVAPADATQVQQVAPVDAVPAPVDAVPSESADGESVLMMGTGPVLVEPWGTPVRPPPLPHEDDAVAPLVASADAHIPPPPMPPAPPDDDVAVPVVPEGQIPPPPMPPAPPEDEIPLPPAPPDEPVPAIAEPVLAEPEPVPSLEPVVEQTVAPAAPPTRVDDATGEIPALEEVEPPIIEPPVAPLPPQPPAPPAPPEPPQPVAPVPPEPVAEPISELEAQMAELRAKADALKTDNPVG